jgi:hypothetical protein
MISAEAATKRMFQKIDALRPSRDVTSKVQLTQLALRKGLTTDVQLETLIKAEPSFDRQLLMDKLEKYSGAVELISRKIAKVSFAIVGGEELLNGTWNPKKPLKLQIMAGNMKAAEANKVYGAELFRIQATLGQELQVEFLNHDAEKTRLAILFNSSSKGVLAKHYESGILKKVGLTKEIDKNGGVRFREITESAGGMRCEAILL